MVQNWLVTGAGRGLGRAIVEAALAAGDCVVAAARTPAALDDLRETYPQRLRTVALDVRSAEQARAAVDVTVEAFGRIDVLVNNAGVGRMRPFETTSEADFRDQVETNFFGVIHLVRAVLPAMRRQRAGCIVNVSSVGGRMTNPGLSAYQAAKWAVSGFTEILARETASFGVRAISVEPGGMRTDWAANAAGAAENAPESTAEGSAAVDTEYESSVGEMRRMLGAYAGHEVGDPAKIAKVIVNLSRSETLPMHLLLGSDALAAFDAAENERRREADAWLAVSKSVDF